MLKSALAKFAFTPCRYCAHNSKKTLIKGVGEDYYRNSVETHSKRKQPSRLSDRSSWSLQPTSASIDSQLPDDLDSDLPRVLYNERETHPRNLPPEFVSNYPIGQSKVLKMLEWQDMMKRRRHVNIPEFYAGSVLRVVYSDKFATDGKSSFVGRVLYRNLLGGIRHCVFLRNVIDGEGVEMEIQLYSPRVHEVTVLRLERWLDQDLLFLRNADPRMCTFPLDMQPEPVPEEIPVFTGKVKMLPKPWDYRWERFNLKNMDRSYLTLPDRERAKRWVYYEYDHSTDIYDDATDQVSKAELKEILKVLKSDQPKRRQRQSQDSTSNTISTKLDNTFENNDLIDEEKVAN